MLAVSIEHASDEAGNQCGDSGWMQTSVDLTTPDFRLALNKPLASFCYSSTQSHTTDGYSTRHTGLTCLLYCFLLDLFEHLLAVFSLQCSFTHMCNIL